LKSQTEDHADDADDLLHSLTDNGETLSDIDAIYEELAARGNGKGPPPVCDQCKAPADARGALLHVVTPGGVRPLHKQCVRFWLAEPWHRQPPGSVIACVQIDEVPTPRSLQ
jgi:hypothetical protein